MSLDKDRLGTALWNRIKADAGGYTPAIGPVQDAQGLLIWKGIADEIIKEFDVHADIVLAAADIHVTPGTFANGAGPVTGQGEIAAVTLTGKLA